MPSISYLRTEDFSLNTEGYRVVSEHASQPWAGTKMIGIEAIWVTGLGEFTKEVS